MSIRHRHKQETLGGTCGCTLFQLLVNSLIISFKIEFQFLLFLFCLLQDFLFLYFKKLLLSPGNSKLHMVIGRDLKMSFPFKVQLTWLSASKSLSTPWQN